MTNPPQITRKDVIIFAIVIVIISIATYLEARPL